jgi:hypothetical protein
VFSQTAQADTALLEKDANDNNTNANANANTNENENENRNEGHVDSSKRAMLGAAMYRSGARAALRAAIGATQAMVDVRKTPLFAPFVYQMHLFTKTGSGQT